MTDPRSRMDSLADQRVEYGALGAADVAPDPYSQFAQWYEQAADPVREPNAMVVASEDPDDPAGPSARVVLLKGFSAEGFVFFTNYHSAKGRQIAADNRVALVFPWHDMHRQVRVRGVAERTSAEASDEYFARRPRGAQLGALASRQSEPVASRQEMHRVYDRVSAEYEGREVPRPDFWGGYLVRPVEIEFWQGQANRFHDRFLYRSSEGTPPLDAADRWIITRLNP
jgi:pyridoxamine 5'-phosphate oxidase